MGTDSHIIEQEITGNTVRLVVVDCVETLNAYTHRLNIAGYAYSVEPAVYDVHVEWTIKTAKAALIALQGV